MKVLSICGKKILLYDCDQFTRQYYRCPSFLSSPSISYSSPPLVCYTQEAETNLVSAPHNNISDPIKNEICPWWKKNHRKFSAPKNILHQYYFNWIYWRVTIGEEQLKGLEIDAPTPRPDPKPVPPYTGMLYPYTGMV